jgi:hypothetical protein
MKRETTIFLAVTALVVAQLACAAPADRGPVVLYPSATPNATQTPVVVTVVAQVTVVAHQTVVAQVTTTPRGDKYCVTAEETVYLRPSPSTDNYPVVALAHGAVVAHLGGRNGDWMFVQYEDKTGWVNKDYIGDCK